MLYIPSEMKRRVYTFTNPLSAELNNFYFYPLEVVCRYLLLDYLFYLAHNIQHSIVM